MICCTIFAALLGLFMRPFVLLRTNPLAWRLKHQPAASDPPLRATGRLQSFSHAFAGLAFLVRNEPNVRIHLAAARGDTRTAWLLPAPRAYTRPACGARNTWRR